MILQMTILEAPGKTGAQKRKQEGAAEGQAGAIAAGKAEEEEASWGGGGGRGLGRRRKGGGGGGACEPWWEVEANHGELALAPGEARAGAGRLERWKGLLSLSLCTQADLG